MTELDDSMEQQIQSIEGFRHPEMTRRYIQTSSCYKMSDQNFQASSFLLKSHLLYHNPKTFILPSQERQKSLLWTEVRTSRWNSLEKRTIKKDRTDHSGNSRSQGRGAQSRHGHRNLQSCNCDAG